MFTIGLIESAQHQQHTRPNRACQGPRRQLNGGRAGRARPQKAGQPQCDNQQARIHHQPAAKVDARTLVLAPGHLVAHLRWCAGSGAISYVEFHIVANPRPLLLFTI